MTSDPRYPVGRLQRRDVIDSATRQQLIQQIADMPAALEASLDGLADGQLDTPYREGGWTVRQVVHHLADSHMNAYIRMRLAVTEDNPTLKLYEERDWAEQPDAKHGALALSVPLLRGLHARWVDWLRSLPAESFARPAIHPEAGALTVDTLLQIYGWHSLHHVAHITALRARQGW